MHTRMGDAHDPNATDALCTAVDVARREGAAWFPDLDPTAIEVDVCSRQSRPRCDLYRLRVHDAHGESSIVVKVRHAAPATVRTGPFQRRPSLMSAGELLSDAAMARREFDGLRAIADGLGGKESEGFGVVRPLALLPEHAAVVMDHVNHTPLRAALMAKSRFGRLTRADLPAPTWANAGSWLRAYHQLEPTSPMPARNHTRTDIVRLFGEYARFLAHHTGHLAFFDELTTTAVRQAGCLPADLPLVVGHGDYALRNVFVSGSGRVTVIDPLPRWCVPPYEDLARFIISMRLLGLQVVSQGLAFRESQLDRYELNFLRGYFADDAIPTSRLRAYQLLVLLDKWSATVSQAPRPGMPRRLAAMGQQAGHAYFRRQARRLLRLLETDGAPPSSIARKHAR